MVRKLAAYGVNTRLLNVIRSWLRDRKARIVVAGSQSEEFRLSNMLFQGTVWGPPLWNAFFGDASCVLRSLDFTVVIYADDYNAFTFYPRCAHNRLIMSELREFQCELHKWGRGRRPPTPLVRSCLRVRWPPLLRPLARVRGAGVHRRSRGRR